MKHGLNITRRMALARAGAFAAAALTAKAANNTVSPVMTQLSNYMSAASARDLPAAVVEKTKHHVLDTLAAMVSGADLPPGRVALQFARAHTGETTATVVGSTVLTGAIEAALINGMLAHSDE